LRRRIGLIVWIALIWYRLWHTCVPITGLEEVWINWLWVRNIGRWLNRQWLNRLIIRIPLRRYIRLIIRIPLRRYIGLIVRIPLRRYIGLIVRIPLRRRYRRRGKIYNRYVGVSWLGHKA
jgi:hypothetical protein